MGKAHWKTLRVRNPFCLGFDNIQQFLVAYPIHFADVSVQAKLWHKRNGAGLHRVIVGDLASWHQGTVRESHFWVGTIEIGSRPVVLLGHPVIVPCFLASVAEEAGLFFTIEIEYFVTVEQLVDLVDPFVFEDHFCNHFIVFQIGHLFLDVGFSDRNGCDFFLS